MLRGCFGVCAGSRARHGEKVGLSSETLLTPMLGVLQKLGFQQSLPCEREVARRKARRRDYEVLFDNSNS